MRLEADRGTRVVLALATGGEEGEVVNSEMRGTIDPRDLPAIRQEELACSAGILGVSQVLHLGYRDSGMAGSKAGNRPDVFVRADMDAAAGAVVRVMRDVRPQVVVTFDDNGGYGHPDHIKINRVTRLAYERAGDATWYPDAGEPWLPHKLYYVVVPREMVRRARAGFEERGLRFTLGTGLTNEDDLPYFPDKEVTTVVAIGGAALRKRESIRCYRTQMQPDFFFLTAPDDVVTSALDREYFVLIRSEVKTEIPENDLFQAIPVGDTSGRGNDP